MKLESKTTVLSILGNMASMIDELVEKNEDASLDQDSKYSEKTINRFRETARALRIAEAMTQRVDWLVCGDDSETYFHKRFDAEMKKLEYVNASPLIDFIETECYCPCCEETRECLPGCTIQDDAPDFFDHISEARKAIKKALNNEIET